MDEDEAPKLPWSDYQRVSARELQLLHGGMHASGLSKKAYVAIGRRGDWNTCSLPVHTGLHAYLPNFLESLLAEVLDEDSFATMNSMFRPGRRYTQCEALKDVLGPDQRRIMEAHRSSESIARLNACWVDVDCYKLGLTRGQVIGQVYDLQSEHKLPSPSYFKDSGRGLWIVWLLGMEVRSYPNDVMLWKQIQAKLVTMFTAAGSDAQSTDAARLSRLLGSKNTKADKRANMVVFTSDTSGKPIRYELGTLAHMLQVEPPTRRVTNKAGTGKLSNKAKGWKGQHQRWKLDVDRFWCLVATIRRTIPVGTRNAHNLVIGSLLRQQHQYEPDRLYAAIEDAAQRVWKHHPRDDKEYSLNVVRKEIRKAASGRQTAVRLTGQTIADLLGLTTREAELVRDLVKANGGGTWPPAKGQEALLPTKLTRSEIRSAIVRYLEGHNYFPAMTNRAIAELVEQELGLSVSHEQIRRMRPAKPTPTATTPPLPLDVDPIAALDQALTTGRRRQGLDT